MTVALCVAARTSAVTLLLALASQAACGKPIELVGVKLDLPFDYRLVSSTELRTFLGTDVAIEQQAIVQPLGATAGTGTVSITSAFFMLDHPDAAAMASAQKREAEQAAHAAGVRTVAKVNVGGHDLEFIDGRVEYAVRPQAMRLDGYVDQTRFQLQVAAETAEPLTPELAKRIQAIQLDTKDFATIKPALKAEAAEAVVAGKLETPLGTIAEAGGADLRLSSSYVVRDADGRVTFRGRNFRLDTSGPRSVLLPTFFTVQFGCGQLGAVRSDDFDEFVRMKEEQRFSNPLRRFEDVTTKADGTLMGLAAQFSSARVGNQLYIHRWAAKDDRDWYALSAERYNGSPIENGFVKQLESAPAACRLDLPWSPDMPAAPVTAKTP